MRAPQLCLLPVYAAVVLGIAVLPVAAVAEPAVPPVTHAAHAAQDAPVAQQAVVLTEQPTATPPLWLLLLLAPVLVGGVIGVGFTLRRMR